MLNPSLRDKIEGPRRASNQKDRVNNRL